MDEKEREVIDIDLGNESTFYVANNGSYFGIGFDKIFQQDELSVFNNFELSSKRNFKNLSPSILSTYEELFLDKEGDIKDDSELIFFNILKVKSDVMVSESLTFEGFIEYLETIMSSGDNLLLNLIDKFVEDNYSLSLDKITQETKDKKKKVNTELQFSDNHAKELLKISYLYRVMIPIISVFFYYNKNIMSNVSIPEDDENPTEATLTESELEELKFDEVNSKIFSYLFEKISKNPEALRNKLYRLTYSGVSKTAYSDKRFWLAAKNVAITERSEALEIYKKILTNAIPKLSIDGDKNVISFLQSVINNQVDFLFQNKFKYHVSSLGGIETSYSTDNDDDSNVSEVEKLEILTSRKNEGSFIIRKMNIKDTLERLPEKFDVGVSDAEVKDILGKITRNPIQENIISLITFKYFEDKDALKYITYYEYCYLLILCSKYLRKNKFIYLPAILMSKCEKHRERVAISGKKVKPEILGSKKYLDLLELHYSNFKESAEEIEKPFSSLVGTIYSSVFKDFDGNEIFDSSVKVGKIAEEILDLSKMV